MFKDIISSSNDFTFNKIKIDTDSDPFEIFKKIYFHYQNVFILESLTGPKELSEFSVIGFEPEFTIKCNRGLFKICKKTKTIYKKKVEDPLWE
jgi:anthranilate/para-aminobenzoate synthase component I